MTYASATPAQKRAVQDAAAQLSHATMPIRMQYNGSGVKNGYDAEALGATMSNALAACGIGSGALLPSQAVVANGGTSTVQTSAGTVSFTGTYAVSGGAVTAITLPASTTMLQHNATLQVINSAGTSVAGTHQIKIAAGGLTQNVTLAATVAPVVSGTKVNAGTVTGSGNFATFTVANGVITGIVLSAS